MKTQVNYQSLGITFSFLIHLLFVLLVFYINISTTQKDKVIILDFSSYNIIKTGEHDTDTELMEKTVVTKEEKPAPVDTKSETKIAVEEKTPEEVFEVIKEKSPLPADEEPETEATVKEKFPVKEMPPEKLYEVIKEEKPIPVYTKSEIKSVVDKKTPDEGKKIVDTPKPDRTPHDIEQSIANQYIRDHFDFINKLIHLNISYPYRARKLSMEGNVIISFVVCLDGSVKDVKIKKSSGFSTLDNNSKKAVRKASPFPPPPVEVKIEIPITYKLGTSVIN